MLAFVLLHCCSLERVGIEDKWLAHPALVDSPSLLVYGNVRSHAFLARGFSSICESHNYVSLVGNNAIGGNRATK